MEDQTEKYTTITIQNLDHAEVEMTGEISFEILSKHRTQAVKLLSDSLAIDGFRQGHIPQNVAIAKLGEVRILEEMAKQALAEAFFAIVRNKSIPAIGRPNITITKLAPNNPLGFKIRTATLPAIDLPDYKKIASAIVSTKDDIVVDQKEVDDAILEIRKAIHHHRSSGILGPDKKPLVSKDVAEEDLPPLDDEMIKAVGDFKDISEFTHKLRENIRSEKTARAKEKKRAEILDEVLKTTNFPLPRILVENELAKMYAQFLGDLERAQVREDEYLAKIAKTAEDLRKEWLPDAEKRARAELVLQEIAGKENLFVPPQELEAAIAEMMHRYKDTKEENIRAYVQNILTNNKVFEFLEKTEESNTKTPE